jgi:hypothetical protein
MAQSTENVQIKHGSTDITNDVINYVRQGSICTGVTTLTLTLETAGAPSFGVWDLIRLWEGGVQKGRYRALEITQTAKGETMVECQDESVRLTDYFITESYFIDYPTYTKTWIDKFAAEAGVSVNYITAGNGVLVSENTSIGPGSAYDVIMQMVQYTGWYFYFDNNGTMQIGELDKDYGSTDLNVNETKILNINQYIDDSFLRNEAHVWGNAQKDQSWVLAKAHVTTPWDRGAKDRRPILYANSNIHSISAAYGIAYKMLDEFAQLKNEKVIKLAGYYNVELGDLVHVSSRQWTGKGLLTSIQSEFSAGGLITTLSLDERCPRLLGYFGFSDWVYTGHNTNGVWRKEILGTVWEDFSTGLEDLHVTDLIIKSNMFACVAGGEMYYRTGSAASWTKYTPEGFTDANGYLYPPESMECVAVDIDTYTNHIYAIYKFTDLVMQIADEQRTFVDQVAWGTRLAYTEVHFVYQGTAYMDFEAVDVMHYDSGEVLPTAIAPALYALLNNPEALFGTRKTNPNIVPDSNSFVFGPLASDELDGGTCDYISNAHGSHILWDNNLGISLNQYNQFCLFNYKEYPPGDALERLSYSGVGWEFETLGLPGLETVYWPNEWWNPNTERLLSRYLYWDGDTDPDGSEFKLIDYSGTGNSTTVRNVSQASLGGLCDYKTPYLEFYNYISTEVIVPSGVQVIDGHTTATGEYVFLKDQDDPVDNGVYITSATNPWVRAPDWIPASGLIVQAKYGDDNYHRCWQLRFQKPEELELTVTELNFQEVLDVRDYTFTQVVDLGTATGNDSQGICVTRAHHPVFYHDKMYLIYRLHEGDPFAGSGLLHYYNAIVHAGEAGKGTGSVNVNFMYTDSYINNAPNLRKMIQELEPVSCSQGVGFINLKVDGETDDPIAKWYISKTLVDPEGEYTYEEADLITILPITGCEGATSVTSQVRRIQDDIAWVGTKMEGEQVDPHFRVTVRSRVNWYNSNCLHCGKWGSHYTEVMKVVRGTLSTGELHDAEGYGGVIYTGLDTVACKPGDETPVCCTQTAEQGSIVPDDIYYGVSGNNQNIVPLTGRWTPTYSYMTAERRSALDDSVIHVYEHPGNNKQICRQTDDFDDGTYMVISNTVYKEIPGLGTVAEIQGDNSIPFAYGYQLFYHGCFMQTQNSLDGQTRIHVLDKNYILNGATLCYLAEDERDQFDDVTGQYTLRDMDFFGFNTEDSKPEPAISWTHPPALTTYEFGGTTYSGIWPENMKVHRSIAEFKGIPVSGMFNDGRTLNFAGTTPSGVSFDYDTMALMATRTPDLVMMPTTTVSGLSHYTSLSGINFSVETSNWGSNPYIFAGLTQPVDFWQKDAGLDEFEEYPGHPASDILVIRLDDRV